MHLRPDLAVRQFMSPDVRSIQVDQKLSDVRRLMAREPFHHLPVVRGRRLVGMLSAIDLARLGLEVHGADPASVDAYLDYSFTVERIMALEPTAVRDGSSLAEVCDLLASGDFHALPVVDAQGDLLGIVTTTDILRLLLATL